MKKALKTTFLYIGTAIGAGFSSGKEIALFFGDASPLNVAVSSVFMALLCGLFLIAGKRGLMPRSRLMGFCIFLSASISLCSMMAGGEYVLRSLSGVPLLGLAMAILGGVIVVLGIEKIKIVNTLLVPLIVLCVALIFLKLDPQSHSLGFSLAKPILYSGLDVLLGGVIISEEGKNLSYKQIFMSCAFISICLFAMLFMLQTVVLADGMHSSMPVLAVAEKFGLKAVCGVLIAAAIFTTLVSSLKIVSDRISDALGASKRLSALGAKNNRSLIVFFCLLIGFPISFVGFDAIVDTMYPFISWCGVALTALVVLRMATKATLRIISYAKRKRNKKIAANGGDLKRVTFRADDSRSVHDDRRIRSHPRNRRRNDNRIRHAPSNGSRPRRLPPLPLRRQKRETCGRQPRQAP